MIVPVPLAPLDMEGLWDFTIWLSEALDILTKDFILTHNDK
jgi:hypothetical protein